jgi:DNA-binding CsgD family transcriptional regulator
MLGSVPSTLTFERVRRDVEVLSHAGLDADAFLTEVFDSLRRALPSDAACVASIDPATGLATGAYKFGALAGRNDTDELWGLTEYGHVEATSYTELARHGVPAVGLDLATGGDARRSLRVRELVQSALGCHDELRLLALDDEQLWGGAALFRGGASAPYTRVEVEFAASLSSHLARGLRVGILARLAEAPPPTASTGPAVLLFDEHARLQQSTPQASERWSQLAHSDRSPAPPAVLASLVAAAWRYAAGDSDVLPSARIRVCTGEWLVLHASPLSPAGGAARSVVVTIEQARPPEIVPLVVAAFGLTRRERDVTRLVLQGIDTREIACVLHLSPHTVQDHLKSVFDKCGVRSRRELVARVFFDQYAPRIGAALGPSGGFAELPAQQRSPPEPTTPADVRRSRLPAGPPHGAGVEVSAVVSAMITGWHARR